jgi:signal transduction histidine kinase
MAVRGRELRDELDTVSRTLLRSASQGTSRTEFLREASAAILGFTGAESLDLWLEDHRRPYHWQASGRPRLTSAITSLSSGEGAERWRRPRDGPSPVATLLDHILPLIDEGGGIAASATRTAGGGLWLRDLILLPFEIDDRDEGVLRLCRPGVRDPTESDIESCESLAHVLGVAIASRRAQAALTERVKELTCMYGIARIAATPNLTLDEALQSIVEQLPAAWQYPDRATARITLDERAFDTRCFESGPRCLSADILVKGTPRGQVEVVYADRRQDRERPILFEEAPFLEEEHNLIQGIARELTSIIERRRAEEETLRLQEQIRHADRLATIGQLAAGIAHELNEPLGNILGFAQLAHKYPDLADQTRQDLEKIVTASLYAREVIKKLLFFSRQTPPEKTGVDLNRVVEDGLSLLEPRCAKAGIAVVRKLAPEAPIVLGDAAQLQQVLVNLGVNAIQAMAKGGTLQVGTAIEDTVVRLTLEDTGVGIPPDNLERIFLPFFTTKDVGAGTGLGLAVVHGIVSLHGGTVRADSEVGRGTRFEIRLPANEETVTGSDHCDG